MKLTPVTASIIQERAYRVIREGVTETLDEFSLDPRLWSILSAVQAHPEGIRLNEVAALLYVQPPLITMRLKELVTLDYITSKKREDDFRSKYLELTEKGKVCVIKTNEKLNNRLTELVKGIKEKDLEIYFNVLQSIIFNGDKENKNSTSL
jgi:DNA-binding MarR family transcriptional regulator